MKLESTPCAELKIMPHGNKRGGSGTVNYYLYKFHKGGNFYQCTLNQILKSGAAR